jgi:hypothetical protein
MDSHAAILFSLIQVLEHFETQLDGITASNHAQIAKAREYMDDSEKQMMPRQARPSRQNRSFLP